jgi:transketolase
VIPAVDGHDVEAVSAAIQAKLADKPTLICCKTVIGKGSPNLPAPTRSTAPPWATRKSPPCAKRWAGRRPFEIPADVYAAWDAKAAGADFEASWKQTFAAYAAQFPAEAAELLRRKGDCRPRSNRPWPPTSSTLEKKETIATRKASQNAIQAWRRRCRNSWAARPT